MAKQITTDEESNLQRQARRRLIGAVALVLAIVVILPMVFDSEPAPTTANDIELRIPDKEGAPPFQPQAASVPPVEIASAVSAASAVASVPASAVSVAPVAAQPVKAAQAESKPKAEPKPKESKPKTEPKPKVEAKATPKPVPQSGFVVQVGAYSNGDAARQLQAKLSKQGFHAYTEKAGSHVRVRIGSYPTREGAEKIRHKLEAQGLHPNVVNLE